MALPQPSPGSSALITGASAGIGAELARALARRGHGVTLVARREERLRQLATELEDEHGVRAEAIACDLSDAPDRRRLVERLGGLGLEVEVLVNNAGFGSTGDFVDGGRERWLRMARVNVESVVDLCARYLPAMVERGRGAVINVASMAAFQPMPGNAEYAASKAFVLSLSESLHAECRARGVTVTALCPGPVRTEFMRAAGMRDAEARTPGVIWMTAGEVAEQGVRGAEHGKRVVVPGLLNRAGALVGQHSPRSLELPFVRQVWRRAT